MIIKFHFILSKTLKVTSYYHQVQFTKMIIKFCCRDFLFLQSYDMILFLDCNSLFKLIGVCNFIQRHTKKPNRPLNRQKGIPISKPNPPLNRLSLLHDLPVFFRTRKAYAARRSKQGNRGRC